VEWPSGPVEARSFGTSHLAHAIHTGIGCLIANPFIQSTRFLTHSKMESISISPFANLDRKALIQALDTLYSIIVLFDAIIVLFDAISTRSSVTR